MIIVLDTSAAVEIVLQRKRSTDFTKYISKADWIVTPSFFIAEITNVFWKYYTFSNLSVDQCEQFIEDAILIPDDFLSEKDLYKEAFILGCQTKQPIYDMYFLVVARRLNALLMTLDASLKKTALETKIRMV